MTRTLIVRCALLTVIGISSAQAEEPTVVSGALDRLPRQWTAWTEFPIHQKADWVQRSLVVLSSGQPTSYGELALGHLRETFDELITHNRLPTATLLDKLNNRDDAPWSNYVLGKPLSGRGLSNLLRPYGIKPTTIRFPHPTNEAEGYYRSNFEDAWERYLPPGTGVTSVLDVTPGW
jgi:hypothetical protein